MKENIGRNKLRDFFFRYIFRRIILKRKGREYFIFRKRFCFFHRRFQNKCLIETGNITVGGIAEITEAAFIFTCRIAFQSEQLVVITAHQLLPLTMAASDTFHIGEDFHTVGRTFYCCHRMRICRTPLNDFQTIGYMVVIKPDNMAGEQKIFDGMRSVKCACRSEAGELSLQFLCGGMVAFRMISADRVDDRCINRMNTHDDDLKERHDFRLFGIHVFVNRYFDFF